MKLGTYSLKIDEQTFACKFTDSGQWQSFPDVVKNYNTGKIFDAVYYYRQLEIKHANFAEGYYFEYGVREDDWEGRMILNGKEYLIYSGFEKDNEESGGTEEWNTRMNLVKASKMSWQLLGTTSFRKRDKEHNKQRKEDFEGCLIENEIKIIHEGAYLGAYNPTNHDFVPSYESFFKKLIMFSIIKSHYLGGPIKLRNREKYGTKT